MTHFSDGLLVVVKATLVALLTLIATRLARGSRASLRHAMLAAGFAVLLALPFASLVIPPLSIGIPAPNRMVATAVAQSFTGTVVGQSALQPSVVRIPDIIFLVWIAGMTLSLWPMVWGLWQMRSLRRSGLPWTHGQAVALGLAREAGILRDVEILLHETLPGPMTCGAARPAILLPADALQWDEDDLNRALMHEMEHIRRGDWLTHCLARAVCSIYWFHPLVWMAWRRFGLEAERACDDAVLSRSEATAYAEQLVGLARRLSLASKSRSERSPLLAMANRGDLASRVEAVLDGAQRRGRAGVLTMALACGAASILVLTLSPLRLVAAPQTDGNVVSSKLVMVDVTVTNANGKPVEGLGVNDFVLTEEGVPQEVSICEYYRLVGLPSYYAVGYYSSDRNAGAAFRKIRVTLKGDNAARLDYRAGYFAGRGNANVSAIGAVESGVIPPVAIRRQNPEYSEQARKAKYSGSVTLLVDVDTSGGVTDVKVVRSLGMGLDEKAIEAVRQWKFAPGTKDGKPMSMKTAVEMSFQLL